MHSTEDFTRVMAEEPRDSLAGCTFCGRTHGVKEEQCPAWRKICTKYGKTNHFSVCCKGGLGVAKAIQPRRLSVCAVRVNEPYQGIRPAEIELNGIRINFRADSGAGASLVPRSCVPNEPLTNTNLVLRMWNGTTVTPTGKLTAILRNPDNDKRIEQVLFVVKENFPTLLGIEAIETPELVTSNWVHEVV
ncbi:hypothetical protein PHET_09330 [Paragonimus heterotremus]|uniref:Peptidase A2 domain-containing protein n=1 Tax=Paragonimus heterotremus TaxID=100268 RepID=A0A8J4SH67_9TREM|nr:hypothetical protein PHET_09330 [Paragonimus heterotremus]